jgi:AcrR family transcriptional regulator
MSGSTSQPAGLRARKKALTRNNLEETALRLFVSRGYEQVRLEDICAACDVSLRTFFRYFTSKEDLVLGRLRAHLNIAEDQFTRRPADEPLLSSLHAVITQTVRDYVAEPERELTRLRLAATTPALQTGLSTVFNGFEGLVRQVAAARMHTGHDARHPRLLAAAAVAAFRVGLEIWMENDAGTDLSALVAGNLDLLAKDVPAASAHG